MGSVCKIDARKLRELWVSCRFIAIRLRGLCRELMINGPRMRPSSRTRIRMHSTKRWTVAPPHAQAADLASRIRTSPVLAQVLLNRGVTESEECFRFLQPSLKCLHDPAGIPNLPKAAARIARAIAEHQQIVI